MPRTVTEKQKQRNQIIGVIAKYQAIYERECSDVAKSLGMSRDTYRKRRQDPDSFTIAEVKALCRTLRIPRDELLQILI